VILKIKDGGGGHLKIEKSQYLCFGYSSLKKIWHGDVSHSSQPRQHIKFYTFNNSSCWPIAIWKIF